MATRFKIHNHCDKRTKNIVNGYIHEMQKLFPWQDNSYFIIPELINHICLSFYWIRFTFNKKYTGDNLKFINDTTVGKTKTGGHELCALEKSISGDMCDVFQIEYTLRNKKDMFCPYIGFFTLNAIDASSQVHWNYSPGYGANNEKISVGICIFHKNKDKIIGIGQGDLYEDFKLKNNAKLQKNDRFMLEFNFIEKTCCIYHNDDKLDCVITLNSSHIIPCMSLYYEYDIIEITKYEFKYVQ